MFKFLLGAALGAGGLWAWQSFGRDLFGMGSNDQGSYGSYSDTPSDTTYGSSSTTPSGTSSPPSSSSSSASGASRFDGESSTPASS